MLRPPFKMWGFLFCLLYKFIRSVSWTAIVMNGSIIVIVLVYVLITVIVNSGAVILCVCYWTVQYALKIILIILDSFQLLWWSTHVDFILKLNWFVGFNRNAYTVLVVFVRWIDFHFSFLLFSTFIPMVFQTTFLLSIFFHANEVKCVDKHENLRSILTQISIDSLYTDG